MKKIVWLILIFSFLLPASAQETGAWPVESRCIEGISEAPPDWGFSGTILMRGYAGVHAYRQEWETPHVLISDARMPEILTEYGTVSPNGEWYAYVTGYTYEEISGNIHASVQGVRVINLDDISLVYEGHFWSAIYNFYHFNPHPVPIWLDNEHIYVDRAIVDVGEEDQIWNPFTGETEDSDLNYSWEFPLAQYSLAPDGSEYWYERGNNLFWLPDSSGYLVAETEDNLNYSLKLMQNGQETLLWELPSEHSISNEVGGFSPDGRYAALFVRGELYLLDMQAERIIKTCLDEFSSLNYPMSMVWSPNSSQIAFITTQDSIDNLYPLVVFDINDNALYRVAYQIYGALMLGWRDN